MLKRKLCVFLLFVLVGCASGGGGGKATIEGTYYANLPCDQCQGVVVDLQLEENKTYSILSHPKDGEGEYYEAGTWHEKDNVIFLTATSGHDKEGPKNTATVAIRQLSRKNSAQNGRLLLLDGDGKPYQKQARRYIFEKKVNFIKH